jgi:hypothetical protein
MRILALSFVAGLVAVTFTSSTALGQQQIFTTPGPFIEDTAVYSAPADPCMSSAATNPGVQPVPTDQCVTHQVLLHRGPPCWHPGGCSCGCDGSCACHGSYKYPVHSQYNYFWPGIYSQQTMTQYVSPWRYPDLNPVPERWKFEGVQEGNPYGGLRY